MNACHGLVSGAGDVLFWGPTGGADVAGRVEIRADRKRRFVARKPKSRGMSGTYPAKAMHHAKEENDDWLGDDYCGAQSRLSGPNLGLGSQGDKKEKGKK